MVKIKIELGNYNAGQKKIVFSEFFTNGERFSSVVEQDSFSFTEALTFGSSMTISTLKASISGKAGYIEAFSSYEYIRVYKDNTLSFEGILASVKRTVVKADYVEASLTYDDYFSLFKEISFFTAADLTEEEKEGRTEEEIEELVAQKGEIAIFEEDGYKVSDPADREHSLLHHLFDLLFTRALSQKFGSESMQIFSLVCAYYDVTPVKSFSAKASDKIQTVLNKFLAQQGLGLHIHCSTVEIVDMLATETGTATTVLDIESGASVEDKPYNTVELPRINTTEVLRAEKAQVAYWHGSVQGSSHLKGNVEIDYTANKNIQELKYSNYTCSWSGSKGLGGRSYLQAWKVVGDKVFFTAYNSAWFPMGITARLYADVVYLSKQDNTISPVLSGDYVIKGEESAEYIHDTEHAERYIKALYLSKLRNKRTYNFYADNNLHIGEVIVINGLPASDGFLKITKKEDKLDARGGFTYTAVKVSDAAGLSTDSTYAPQDVELKDKTGFEYAVSRKIIPANGAGVPTDSTPVTIRITPNNAYQTPALLIQNNAVTLTRDTAERTDGEGNTYTEELDSYSYLLDAALNGLDSVVLTMTVGTETKTDRIEKAKAGQSTITALQFSYGTATAPGENWTSESLSPVNTAYLWCRTGTYTPPETEEDVENWQVFRLGGEIKNFELLADRSTFIRNMRAQSGYTTITLTPQISTYQGTYRIRCFINSKNGDIYAGYVENSLTAVIPYTISESVNSLVFVMDMTDSDGVYHTSAVSASVSDETGARTVLGARTEQITPSVVAENGVYFIKGDSYTYVYEGVDASGRPAKISEVWIFDDTADPDGAYWHKAEYYSSGDMAELDNILLDNLKNVFEQYGGLNHVEANGYDWFKYVIAEHISAIYYNVGGFIYGGNVNFNASGDPVSLNGRGFIISADGKITINDASIQNAELDNCYISNNLNFSSGAEIKHPVFSTFSENYADSTGVAINTTQNRYNIKDLYNLNGLTANQIKTVSGTYGSAAVTKLVKLTAPSTTMCDVSHNVNLQVVATTPQTSPGPEVKWVKPANMRAGTLTIRTSNSDTDGAYLFKVTATNLSGSAYSFISKSNSQICTLSSSSIDFSKAVTVTVAPDEQSYSGDDEQDTYTDTYVNISGSYTSLFSDEGFSTNGLLLYYSGAWHNMGTDTLYNSGTALKLTSGVSWDSANYLRRLPTNLCDYKSFTYTDSSGATKTQTLANNVPYPAVSSGFTIDGVSVSIKYFSRQSGDIVTLTDSNNKAYTFIRGQYYRLTGTSLKISGSSYGLQTKSLYPDANNKYDIGRSDRYYKDLYVKNLHADNIKYVTDTWTSGRNWYRVWSDGFCEQGGRVSSLAHKTLTDVTLFKNYKNTSYSVMACNSQTGYGATIGISCSAHAVSGFRIYQTNTASATMTIDWVARGYVSSPPA